jgi:hypothetical protein
MSAEKKRVGRPPKPQAPVKPALWESEKVSTKLQKILDAIEVPPSDLEVRRILQRMLYRQDYFGGDGRGHITLLIRTILESEGNQDALIEPIVGAVSSCMRPEWTEKGLAWIEAFDQLKLTEILLTMRSLDLFGEQEIGHYYSIAIRNKLFNVLGPATLPKPAMPAKPKAKPKPPARRATDQPAPRMAA